MLCARRADADCHSRDQRSVTGPKSYVFTKILLQTSTAQIVSLSSARTPFSLLSINPLSYLISFRGSAFPATLAFQIREIERETKGDVKLDAIVTVVDAENFVGYEDTSPTAKMQSSYTDIILIVCHLNPRCSRCSLTGHLEQMGACIRTRTRSCLRPSAHTQRPHTQDSLPRERWSRP